MKIKTNYITQENKLEMIKYIRDFINDNKEVIIVNIGTDKVMMDLLSPLVGTILKENNCPLEIYGDLEFPMHAKNLGKRYEQIKIKHPTAKVIGLDACLGDKSQIGEIQIRDCSIHPGAGVGKNLTPIGDISIVGFTDESKEFDFFMNSQVRLSLVYNMAKVISDIILTALDSSSKNIKFYNRNKSDVIELNTYKEVAAN